MEHQMVANLEYSMAVQRVLHWVEHSVAYWAANWVDQRVYYLVVHWVHQKDANLEH
jgi:hypothetical protein